MSDAALDRLGPPDRRAGPLAAPLEWREAWLSIDTNERAVAFAGTRAGGLVVALGVVACLAAGMQLSTAALALVGVTLLAMAALPRHALAIMLGASLFYFVLRPFRIEGWTDLLRARAADMPFTQPLNHPLALQLVAVALVLALSAAFLLWQRRHAHLTAAKRPVLTLVLGWFALLALAIALPLGSAANALAWSLVGVAVSSIWILAYSAVDARAKRPAPALQRAIFLRPFWGGSAAPIGKSFGYLDRFAARDAADLGVTRLKALKLAVWALVLSYALIAARALVYGEIGLVPLETAVLAHAADMPLPTAVNWASLVANYFIDLMVIAVWGHFIVAIVRMAGYRIPRNTVNPLASRTLAEFWNRYFFYFKELLVDFFFYPAFQRFKLSARARIAFATLCAAGLGNFLYHFMRETWVFADAASLGELVARLAIFQSAAFYSLALATGLIVSQLRGAKAKPEDGFFAYHVRPRLGVIAFFCFLKIFDDITGNGTFLERAAFAASLIGA